ncbi:hypothetical protein WK90_32620 [Burkholderia cepacia]|uniref:hypothetical protein n=1 Tax=Burkholderia cepacia TaxID=292 RepID=UPI00075C830E|nr:hypothetical protein [Burkholderia cepacia]KVV50140.1 hypothetical protein WK83_32450 [Burkholderia cepacia]KVV67363.1 hypothetical protein WK85_24135 [Burkholderia cepacia]KVV70633.1 hypothetical protein WK84_13350 [Burkholderia cepacia]KVV77040.1 hypothetical protein WK87_34390 [Burkholderia cepacia]KVV85156.1 hypothetical protein WK86_11405 [Burkholderia cepacia]
MNTENISLIELLDSGGRFEVFAEALLDKGWVSDEELHITPFAFRRWPQSDELRPLVRKYGFDDVRDLPVQALAFRLTSNDFVYCFYDAKRFESFEKLVAALRKAGIDVRD